MAADQPPPHDPAPDAGAAAKRALLEGSVEGLERFQGEHLRPLYAFAFHRVGRDHHAAEEVVQETLLVALERIASYDPARGDLHTWLSLLARNVIRRVNRERRRFQSVGSVEATVADEARGRRAASALAGVDLGRDPLDAAALDREETAALVSVALERLPGSYRGILERKYVCGESVRAIAADGATTEKAVESLLGRAREAFRHVFRAVARAASAETEQWA